jgi:hypothetical protein
VIWRDKEIEVRRVTIAPHSTIRPFVHAHDYVFVPLTNAEIIQSVRGSANRNPLVGIGETGSKVSWMPRGTEIRFMHPAETEPFEGQALFNSSENPYVAVEIEVLDQSMPQLQPRFSLFANHDSAPKSWRLGKYALRVQPLKAGQSVSLGETQLLFSTTPMNLAEGQSSRTILAGELQLSSKTYTNTSTFGAQVLLLGKTDTGTVAFNLNSRAGRD